jgi:hypothetical protein
MAREQNKALFPMEASRRFLSDGNLAHAGCATEDGSRLSGACQFDRRITEMKKNCVVDHDDMGGIAEIQELIKGLRPFERTALRDWLNGYEGNALILSNTLNSSFQA